MNNHCSGLLVATFDRVDFVHWIIFQRPASPQHRLGEARSCILDRIGPETWNSLARSADFYSRKQTAIRNNAIATIRKSLPQGVVA